MTFRRDRRLAALAGASLAAAALLVIVAPAAAQPPRIEKAAISVQADRTAYLPGEEGTLVTWLAIDEHWHVNSNRPSFDFLIATEAEVELPPGWGTAEVVYPQGEMQTFAFADEPLSVYQGRVALPARFIVPVTAAEGEATARVTVTYQACDDRTCLPPVTKTVEQRLVVGPGGEPVDLALATESGGGGGATGPRSLPVILGLALLGGLILNAMPCVLPVLSLKVFSLVKSASLSRRDVVTSGLATAAGILASFWALALAAVAARAAGQAVGWGVQFQQPAFVAFLAVIVVLFSLNLWGLFEVRLPGTLARAAGQTPREGLGGHFVSGLFATLMATPCSAPFLGPAVGFAMSQTALTILLVFTALGIGMALPYLLLAARPGLARFFPRPGDWMIRLKEVLGFLLAGTAVWLFYVLASQVSAERLAYLQAALIGLALVVWLGRQTRRDAMRRLAWVGVVAVAAGTLWIAATAPAGAGSALAGQAVKLVPWVPFDRDAALELAANGQPVFVDVTADWCFTCKINERLVLETPEVAAALAAKGVVPMKADWTNRDETIGRFLAEHGRYGIPFYLLYRPGHEPLLFGELLTKERMLGELGRLPGPPPAAEISPNGALGGLGDGGLLPM